MSIEMGDGAPAAQDAIDVDGLLSDLQSTDTHEIPMGDEPQAQPQAQAQAQQPVAEEYVIDWNGKQIKATREQALQWAQKGYDYNQKMQAYNQQKAEFDKQYSEYHHSMGNAVTIPAPKLKEMQDEIASLKAEVEHLNVMLTINTQLRYNALVKERDQLREEVERLTDVLKTMDKLNTKLHEECDRLTDEVVRLKQNKGKYVNLYSKRQMKEQLERLREANKVLTTALREISHPSENLNLLSEDDMRERAREALKCADELERGDV